jgi:hypothetical protein
LPLDWLSGPKDEGGQVKLVLADDFGSGLGPDVFNEIHQRSVGEKRVTQLFRARTIARLSPANQAATLGQFALDIFPLLCQFLDSLFPLGLVAGGREGFGATLFYTTTYAFTLVGAFAVVAMVRRETGGDDFRNFAALWSRSPLLSGCMAIFMLSLAGLPPLAGFFGKFYLFSAALRAGGNHGLLWLVVLALLGSFISLYYYLAVLKAIFVDDPETGTLNSEPSSPISLDFLQRISLISLAGIVLVLGLLPGSFVSQIAAALSSLP